MGVEVTHPCAFFVAHAQLRYMSCFACGRRLCVWHLHLMISLLDIRLHLFLPLQQVVEGLRTLELGREGIDNCATD